MNKKGQFYLIAGMVIVGIIMGFTTIANNADKSGLDKSRIYEMMNSLDIKNENLLKYNQIDELTDEELLTLVEEFVEKYSLYLQGNEKIYFIVAQGPNEMSFSYAYDNQITRNIGEGINYELGTDKYVLIFEETSGEHFSIQG